MRTVMVVGTFDMIHPGHLHYFMQARRYGDYVIAVVARDATVEKERGTKPVVEEKDRQEVVQHIDVVDEAVLGNQDDKLRIVEQKQPDVICLGYDHEIDEEKLKEALGKRGVEVDVVRATAYKEYASHVLKEKGHKD